MVRIFVAVTDNDWFRLLAASGPHEEVNFWQPSGRRNFGAIGAGELFLFKLHAPDNYIAGGGIFSHATNVPLSIAWEAFQERNGVPDLPEMWRRIARYRRDDSLLDQRQDPVIGCRVLTQPFFWPRELWISVPATWAPNTQVGKRFETTETDGKALWDAVMERMSVMPSAGIAQAQPARFGAPQLISPRLGQGAFRLSVIDSYERRCAVTGERTLPILDAAHIRAFGEGGEHIPSNGLLLRTDVHRLFDLGYVTVAPERRFVVSNRLRADFDNGRDYYALHGRELRPPRNPDAMPSPNALAWHRERRFLG